MADVQTPPTTSHSRWSSLSSRLALLIAIVLILSGLVTAVYSAVSARSASAGASETSMANVHRSTGLLIDQAYADTQRARQTALESRRAELKDVASPIAATLEQLRLAVQAGELTLAQAQQRALETIKATRYRKDDYFFAYDRTGTAIAHPNPQFQGKNLIDMQDPNGVYVIRELLTRAQSPEGSGYLDYAWVKLDETTPSPKVGYVFGYKPWDWMIGTGVYVDDIDKEAAARLETTKKALGDAFSKIDFTASGLLFVLDQDGTVVVQPAGRDLGGLPSTDWGRSLASTLVSSSPSTAGTITPSTQQAAFTGTLQPWRMDLSSFPDLGWTLVSAVPQSEIDAPGNSQALRQALLSLGVLTLGLVIGLLSSRRIVKPVEQITTAAVALGDSTFDPSTLDAAAARRDEVGTLARTFQRMGADVVERERKLREQVTKLSVVIDRQKVTEEAGAITDSDYFRELKQRASELRDRDSPPVTPHP